MSGRSEAKGRGWVWLCLVTGGGTVLGALVVRALGLDAGRLGSYLGFLILAAAFLALLSGIASFTGWRDALIAALGVMAVGGTAEVLGLYWRLPFGRYEYTDWWIPYVTLPGGRLYPLLLPATWYVFVSLCYLVLARRLRGWKLVAGTAVLATLVDLVLEPVLTRVVLFWRWLEPTPLLGAPYRNLAGWLVTAALGACCLQALRVWRAGEWRHPALFLSFGLACTAVIGVVHGEPRGALALVLLPVLYWARSHP